MSCSGADIGSGDGNALTSEGLALADQGRYVEAEPLLRRALTARQSMLGSDSAAVGQSSFNLGYLYRLEGRYIEAEPLLRRALAIRERTLGPDDPTVAKYLNELGYLYQLVGRTGDAEPLYTRALAIQERTLQPDDTAIAGTLINLGYLARTTGRYAEAEQYYRRCLAIREKLFGADSPGTAQVLDNLGNLYRLQGRGAEAEPLEKRSLAIREKALGPDHPDVADTLGDLGELYRSQRRYPEAEQALQRSLAIREKALGPTHPYVATRSLGTLAALYEAEGKSVEALQVSTRAVDVLQRHLVVGTQQRSGSALPERRLYRDEFLRNIALLYGANGRIAEGGDAVDRSFQVGQLAVASTAGQAVAGMAARFASGSDALAASIRQLQDLNDRWQQLDGSIVKAAGQQTANRNSSAEAALRRSFDDTGAQIRSLEASIAAQFPAYATLTNPSPLSIKAVQALLAPDEAMLVYLVGDDAVWLWALRQDRSALYRIDLRAADLTTYVTALRARLDPWQNDTLQPFPVRGAYYLYQKIMLPAASFLDGARNILVVPDGALESLPLSVLVTRPPAGDPVTVADHRNVAWLAKDHAITVLPSVASLRALRLFASSSRASSPFTGIGNPVLSGPSEGGRSVPAARGAGQVLGEHFDLRPASLFRGGTVDVAAVRELPPLPETAGELRTIGRVLGATDDDLYLGGRASEPVIRGAHLDKYRVVEFATHGLMSGDLGLGEPALVLTPPDVASPDNDGLLTASKIAAMKFDADWVVLSACNTAASDGSPDAGGLSGLAKAFFYAGARSMLVSHWSVDSAATVKLTTGAFAALAKEPAIGRAEALRRSMMAMLDPSNPPELSHPLAWAPFVLAGEGGAGR